VLIHSFKPGPEPAVRSPVELPGPMVLNTPGAVVPAAPNSAPKPTAYLWGTGYGGQLGCGTRTPSLAAVPLADGNDPIPKVTDTSIRYVPWASCAGTCAANGAFDDSSRISIRSMVCVFCVMVCAAGHNTSFFITSSGKLLELPSNACFADMKIDRVCGTV